MSIGPLQILLLLVVVVLLFGTSKLRNIGGDLGNAIKSFRRSMSEEEKSTQAESKKTKVSDQETHK